MHDPLFPKPSGPWCVASRWNAFLTKIEPAFGGFFHWLRRRSQFAPIKPPTGYNQTRETSPVQPARRAVAAIVCGDGSSMGIELPNAN